MLTQIQRQSSKGHGHCTTGRVRRRQHGFTLIELMIVVAIVGVLAALAVSFFGGTRNKINAKTEVSTVFAELKIRQEQLRTETGNYLSTSTDETDDTTMYPTGTPTSDGSQIALPSPAIGDMATLRFSPDLPGVRCGYLAIAGDGGDDSNVGNIAQNDFNYIPPQTDWYYLLAKCDMDQDSAVDSYYFQHSDDSKLYFIDQGK